MFKLRGTEVYLLIPYVVSTLYFNRIFIDPTTYPKLLTQVLLLVILVLISFRNSRNPRLLFVLIAIWFALLSMYLVVFGQESLSSTLLGYPQRNLGLLSILVFMISLWIFYENGISSFIVTLRWIGLLLAGSVVASHLGAQSFLVNQFVQPNPDSLNSNVLSPVLAFSVVACLSIRSNEERSFGSFNSRLLRYSSILFLLYASYLLGNFQSLLYFFYLLSALAIFRLNPGLKRKLLTLTPLLFSLFYILSVSVFENLLERFGDSSTKERLILIKLFWSEVIDNFIYLRSIDSSADLNLSDQYSPGVYAIIDNAHNVWLEIGIHFGFVTMFVCFFSFLLLICLSAFRSQQTHASQIVIGFEESKSFIVFQQLAFFSLFFAILHPVSIWIYGSIVGISWALLTKKTEKLESNSHPFASKVSTSDKNSITKLVSGGIGRSKSLFVLVILVTTSTFVALDATKKYEFRQVEKALVNNQIEFEEGIDHLVEITLQLNDRGYLDYSGRQLMDLRRCETVKRLIEEQEALRFTDLDSRLLSSAQRSLCTPALTSDLVTIRVQ